MAEKVMVAPTHTLFFVETMLNWETEERAAAQKRAASSSILLYAGKHQKDYHAQEQTVNSYTRVE